MPDEDDGPDIPDIRVVTITLRPPDWIPDCDWSDDLDDFGAVQILEIAWQRERDKLWELMGLCGEDTDDD